VFNPTVARITLRALFGRRRVLLLLPLPVLLVGLALLSTALGGRPEDWAAPVITALGINVMLPVIALIVGTGVLGSEIEDGTIAHILAKPLARREILLSKLVVAIGATALTAGVPLVLTGLIAESTQLALGLAAGALVGSLAYCSLFALLSVVSRHPVIIGLFYVLIWEGFLTNILTGTRTLSVTQYVLSVVDRVSTSDLFTANVSLAVALSMTFIFTVGFTLLAIDRLRSFAVVGETS
jgi:ABC-2 type transport system permease protein